MKTLRFLVIVATGLVLILSYNGCKKGPEDPAISFVSRKARVVGDWNVTSYKVDDIDSLRQILKAEPQLGACGQENDSIIWTSNIHISFSKDGAVLIKTTLYKDTLYDIINNTAACPDVFIHDSTIVTTAASWNFTGKIGDVKNKEQIIIFDTETKFTTIYDLIELRSKEIKMQTETIDPLTNVVHTKAYTLTKI